MDCSTLPANGLEDNITEDMLEFYMEHALVSATPSNVPDVGSINLGGYVWGKQRDNGQSASFSARQGSPLMFGLSPARAPRLSRTELSSGSLMGLESMEDIVMQRQSRRTSVQQRPLLESESHEDVASDITSDDSGDFAFFTQDVRDANAYDTIRDYVVYCKQQERDLEELEEECARLEAEQQQLYGAAMAAKMTRRSSVAAGGASSTVPGLSSTNGKGRGLGGTLRGGTTNNGSGNDLSFLSDVADEFGEGGIDPLRACPLTELPVTSSSCSGGSAKSRSAFRYAAPDVVGDYNPVFKSGFLYRCATPEGLWVFYNDSHKYQMEVRYLFGATSVIAAGPHAVLKRLPSGEMEVAVTVWPQETEVLLQGEVNGFKNLSVATPVDASYVNPHTAATTAEATALLGRVARQCGKSSTAMLTTADVLDCCLKEKDAAKAQAAGMHFVDPAFPPSRASLCRRDVDDAFLWDMPWRRPTAYLPQRQAHEASLFAGAAALPTDPSTGDGGDAYLCSAAALLAEAPERVYRLFRHPNPSPDAARAEAAVGAYHVTLGHGGWWTTTVVDDYLPASLRGPDLGRCTHDLRKLWYPLLEKAYAKLHGSYAAIQYGDPLEALQDFTGFPTFRFDEEWAEVAEDVRASFSGHGVSAESEALFAMLESKVRDCGYLVCLSLPDEGPAEAKSVHMGMLYGMSYAVLRVVRYGDYRLLQVRCPTLRLDGDGLWCAESVRWRQEPELARLCGMASGAEDGSSEDAAATPGGLWLDWSEALLMFEGGGVCCVHSSWTEDCRVRGAFHDGVPSCVLEVYVHEEEGSATTTDGGVTAAAAAAPVEVYCVLSQEDDRGLPPDHPNRALLPLMLCVSSALEPSDVTDTEATLSCSVSSRQCIRLACSTDPDNPTDQLSYILGRDTALRTKLQPSTQPYYIVPRCLGEMSSKLFTVGIISATPVTKSGRLQVRAVQLPSTSPVFKNQRVFSAERVTPVAAASFQLRGADGRVRVGCGSGIG